MIQPSYPPDDNVAPGCCYAFSVITLVVLALDLILYVIWPFIRDVMP